jgi:hypothetical protein
MTNHHRLISTREAAATLRCTPRAVLTIAKRGELRAVVTYLGASRRLFFDAAEVHALARKRLPEMSAAVGTKDIEGVHETAGQGGVDHV